MSNQKPFQGIQVNNSYYLRRNLISCIVLNEFGSNIVNNNVSLERTGDVSGATWQSGLKGAELDFSNSTSDVIDLGVPFLGSNLEGLTVEIIIRINSTSLGQMFAEDGDAYDTNSFYLTITSGDVMEFLVSDGVDYSGQTGNTAMIADGYYHCVGVWNPGSYPEVYLNGQNDNGGVVGGSSLLSSLQDGNTNLEIGKRPDSVGNSFDGGVVFFAVFNKALDANEIMRRYSNPYEMFDDWDYGFISVGATTSIIALQNIEFDLLAYTQLLSQLQSVQGVEFALLAYTQLLSQLQSIQGTEFALLSYTQLLAQLQSLQGVETDLLPYAQLLTQIQAIQGVEFDLLAYTQSILTSALLLASNGDLVAPNFLIDEIISLLEAEGNILPYTQTIANQLDLQGVLITLLGFAGNTSILLLQNVVGSLLAYSETITQEIPVQETEFDLLQFVSSVVTDLILQDVEFSQLDFQFLIVFLITLQGIEFTLLDFSGAIDFLNSIIYCIEKKGDIVNEVLKHNDIINEVIQGEFTTCQ